MTVDPNFDLRTLIALSKTGLMRNMVYVNCWTGWEWRQMAHASEALADPYVLNLNTLNRPGSPVAGTRRARDIPFSSTSVWNIGIGGNAAWAAAGDAETVDLNSLNMAVNAATFGQPIYYGDPATDQQVQFHCVGNGQQAQVPWDRVFYCPAGAVEAAGSDGHLNVYDSTQPNKALSMCFVSFNNGVDLTSGVTAQLGAVVDLTRDGLFHPVDFYGTDNYLAGVITQYDVSQGTIRHALRCAISQAHLLSPNPDPGGSAGIEWPNDHVDYYHGPGVYTGIIPVGTYGIPSSVNLTTLGLTTGGMMLARALQDYGCIWRDQGGTNAFIFYSVPELDNNPRINEMRGDGSKIIPLLRRMINQGPGNVNGGGVRRVPLLEGLAL